VDPKIGQFAVRELGEFTDAILPTPPASDRFNDVLQHVHVLRNAKRPWLLPINIPFASHLEDDNSGYCYVKCAWIDLISRANNRATSQVLEEFFYRSI
jgi:hypothetical protein